MTAALAKRTSMYTKSPYPASCAVSVRSVAASVVVLAMMTPVRMNSTVLATKVSISQK